MRPAQIAVALTLFISLPLPTLAFELSEQLLGLSSVPFKVGQTLTPEELSSHKCQETENGLVVCAMGQSDKRGFGIVLDKTKGGNRVTGVLSFWKCDSAKCPDAVKETVAQLSKQLGAEPGLLDGTPIWRDREKRHRDLMVQQLGSEMVSIVLIESYP